MRVPEFIAQQARRPTGALGWILGKIMSVETRSLNAATLEALNLQPTDRVLEVGFGHGRTIRRAAEAASAGLVAGVDYSETMLAMASRSSRPFIAEGRVQLKKSDSSRLPFPDEHFDKAYAVHTLYFWKNPVDHLREIRRVLRRVADSRSGFGLRTTGAVQTHSRTPSTRSTMQNPFAGCYARASLTTRG